MADSIIDLLRSAPVGFLNGARSFGEQAKWMMGGYGNAPMPAPYDGGPQYPSPDDANAYVRHNWPNETGIRGLVGGRPDTFYTPPGFKPPPHGRGPTIGEDIGLGRTTSLDIAQALARILANR